jgi:ATP-dependent protease ClpP protease subunit
MSSPDQFTVACLEMGTHEASIAYTGTVTKAGAMALEQQLEQLFGYYRYSRIHLTLESPGGSIDALEYIVRQMHCWEQQGRVVAVQSTFECASAAAVLLAFGLWGERSVDRHTYLLWHSARIDSAPLGRVTAASSGNLHQGLSRVDSKMLDLLLNRMQTQAGGAQALADLIGCRVAYVQSHWKELATATSSLTMEHDGNRNPDWLKTLQKLVLRDSDPQKLLASIKKHLSTRLQSEVRMHLCEAYCLCLIDEIREVIHADSPQQDGLRQQEGQGHGSPQVEDHKGQKSPDDEGEAEEVSSETAISVGYGQKALASKPHALG